MFCQNNYEINFTKKVYIFTTDEKQSLELTFNKGIFLKMFKDIDNQFAIYFK